MNDIAAFVVYAFYVVCLLWAAGAAARRVNRRYDRPGQGR